MDPTRATNRPGLGRRDGQGLSEARRSSGPKHSSSAARSCRPRGGGLLLQEEASIKEKLVYRWKSAHFKNRAPKPTCPLPRSCRVRRRMVSRSHWVSESLCGATSQGVSEGRGVPCCRAELAESRLCLLRAGRRQATSTLGVHVRSGQRAPCSRLCSANRQPCYGPDPPNQAPGTLRLAATL